jgi:GAF domain-containing protein
MWGVITVSRTVPDEPFSPGAEHGLGDFAALLAQAIANSEARREVAALAEEQAALRRVATLVAAGRPQVEVVEAVTREAGQLFGAQAVHFVHWEGVLDEVVVGGWTDWRGPSLPPGSRYHPTSGSATLQVLETGFASRNDEASPELGTRFGMAPELVGVITPSRRGDNDEARPLPRLLQRHQRARCRRGSRRRSRADSRRRRPRRSVVRAARARTSTS